MVFLNARWTDDGQTMIRAERADGSVVFIPPDPANADYRALTEGGEDAAPVEIAPPDAEAPE
ncbi:MAG: hypothetical protein JJU18_13015 [Oceanicaulis sp.]|nr:hypothetical protein [Oceanicaulis sp.]